MKKLNWQEPLALFDVAQTRQLEHVASARIQNGPTLMSQAGLSVAKLAMAIKPFIMDNAVVVGVGNIYAAEACWHARISPRAAMASSSVLSATRSCSCRRSPSKPTK